MTGEPSTHAHPDPDVGPGYETRDASVPGLLTFGAGLILFLVVTQIAMLGVYRLFVSRAPEPTKTTATENLYQQLRDLHDREKVALGGYGWVDRDAGVVRIPIERAIDLVAEKGDRFSKGPKSELEMNSHGGTPVPPTEQDKDKTPPEGTGTKP